MKFFADALELFINPLNLLPRRGTLLGIQFHGLRTGEPPVRAVHNRGDHLQIADQFGTRAGRRFLLTLRFEKQRGIFQNAFADRGRPPAPSRIQLAGFARIAVMLGEDRRHPLAVVQAVARHRHQELHSHLRRDLTFAHLLLNRLRQQLHQGQPPRHPCHATIKPSRQLRQAVAEALLQLLKQPAHLQRGFAFGKTQRAVQQSTAAASFIGHTTASTVSRPSCASAAIRL